MKRTTVFIDDDLLLEARHLAKQRETTFTEIVQEALRTYVQANRPTRRISFIGIGRSGHPPQSFHPEWDEQKLRDGIAANDGSTSRAS